MIYFGALVLLDDEVVVVVLFETDRLEDDPPDVVGDGTLGGR